MKALTTCLAMAVLVALAGCSKKPPATAEVKGPVQSDEFLARAPVTDRAEVKHVLVAWAELAPSYGGRIDPRAAARQKPDADKLAVDILERVKKGEAIESLMSAYSEDPGSAKSGQSYTATPDAPLVPPFKDLSLRLQVGEAGIVQTTFGWHIIKRVN